MKKINIEAANIVWEVSISARGHYIGYCPALGLSMEGDDLEELQSLINETMLLFFRSLLEENELESFLKTRGWKISENLPEDHKQAAFNIPWQLLVGQRANDTSRINH